MMPVAYLQRWECVVLEATEDVILCELHDLTDESRSVEVAEIYRTEFSVADNSMLEPGTVFYWDIGVREGRRFSNFLLRQDQPLTESQMKAIDAEANSMSVLFTPRFTLTPDGCGVLDRERPGMVCPFESPFDASSAVQYFTNGTRGPDDYGWVLYTPPEAPALEQPPETTSDISGPCSYCGNPDHWRPDCDVLAKDVNYNRRPTNKGDSDEICA